jgi:Protein of unknown function (DUF1592)/Protein of unknown function (DUF1588)/Protein of unknown function (DUF1595)/Protein of unknown function (DUF1585)/Protein of unknown function (DUF1587)
MQQAVRLWRQLRGAILWTSGVSVLALGGFSCTGTIEGTPWQGSAGAGEVVKDGGLEPSTPDRSTVASGSVTSDGGATTGGGVARDSDGWPTFSPSQALQLRRLTTEQYVASIQTLLGVKADGMPPIEPISKVGGFSAIGASTASVSETGVGQFEAAARFFAQAAFATGGPGKKLVPCTPAGVDDATCFTSFIAAFGPKVFRRPLTADETARYTTLTQEVAKATGDPWQGLEATVSALLQSPNFLYLPELGAPDPAKSGRYRYGAYEIAARLSYFLSNNTPDDTLLGAAASGALLTADGVAAQVKRLLDLPAARDSVRQFFSNLLALESLDTLTRPVEVFPKFTATLGPAMKQETLLVLDDLVFGRDGDYRHVFDQPETFVNAELAAFYGIAAPAGGGFGRVTLPASSGRAGLLGHAGVLAARDHSDGTSPTKRGLFVLTRLLCQNLPLMPPANIPIPPPPTGLLTAKQRLAEHASNAVCAACHRVTDPVGLSLEHFDAMGAYRANDHGLAIDDTGELDGQTYHGELELGALLRDHPALGPCLIQALYGVAVGHLASDFDRDTFAALAQEFADNGGRIRSLLAKITASDGFRYLPAPMEK